MKPSECWASRKRFLVPLLTLTLAPPTHIGETTIHWEIPTDQLKEVKRFPVPVVVKHNDHYLVCYLDSHYQLADTEIAVAGVEGKAKK